MSKKIFWPTILFVIAISAAIGLLAPTSHNAAARAIGEIAPVSDVWRAALPHDPAAATDAYMARISPAAKARSDAYFEGGYWLTLWDLVMTLVASWLLLTSGVLARLRDKLEQRSRSKGLLVLVMGLGYILLSTLISLPLTVYQGFYREHEYGLANQTLLPWLGEQAIATAVACIIGPLFLALIYWVIRRAPKTWPVWGAVVTVGFMSFMMLLGPVYIDPLFNTYKPITDEKIKQPILSMARANGVPTDNVYEFDASKQSNRISANVSGIFGSAAVRMNDNLLKRTTLPEIKGVLGHEIGHYVLDHIYTGIIEFGIILVVGFAFLHWALRYSITRWGQQFGIRDASDPLGLPLVVGIFSIYMFAATPVLNTMTRVQEAQADAFGLNASQEPDGFAEVDLKLTEYRKSNPGDLEEFFFFDHPSPKKRIFASMRWKAEHLKLD
ncbi:M48 family metallopeptidase [Solimicrobium silvestre]|uniref:Peptidase family M48 n=1 Tax=Solimicrobium silvestre TaxID=2099400 RepID=A0A2S9GY08_9BURK|nr:M48 family metallopeptidase [Solimicrobium silvestre]PRC92602.1 Peptidase family M48 [Solimicrobium silvestre]